MEAVRDFLQSVVDHWKRWGLTGLITAAASAITWAVARRKDWAEAKSEKLNKDIDARVMAALEDRNLWTGPRPMTGVGDLAVRADELAQALALEYEDVVHSLERLVVRERIANAGGQLSDPTPRWHSTRRF